MIANVSPTATPRVGLVLAGGAARGAYEVGVLQHIVEKVSDDIGRDVPIDVLSGTSVGAINACTMAAWADEPRARVGRLSSVWQGLRIAELLRPMSDSMLNTLRGLMGRTPSVFDAGALFDSAPLEQLLTRSIPFRRIQGHLRAGRIQAVTVSATQIASGRTVVFLQRRHAQPAPWWGPTVVPRPVRLRAAHTLASAAVPFLFPPVIINGHYYCDGGLRQNVPISPARRMGATALVVVIPKHRPKREQGQAPQEHAPEPFPSPVFLLGKTLNALMLDRIDNEIDRLEKINDILNAGRARYGQDFVAQLNEQLGNAPAQGLRTLDTVSIHASRNIGELSADYVRSPHFRVFGVLGKVMQRLADGEASREADLLSYLLFDGRFAGQLIQLGREDARAQHQQLCALFDGVCAARARAQK